MTLELQLHGASNAVEVLSHSRIVPRRISRVEESVSVGSTKRPWQLQTTWQAKKITTGMEKEFLSLLPTVQCISPINVLDYFKKGISRIPESKEYQLMDCNIFKSDSFQRSYQYLKKYRNRQSLDTFCFTSSKIEGSEKECLEILLEYCGRRDPSWTEINNFACFLSLQLKKCECSVFCSEVVQMELRGFKAFVIKFMIRMAKDFAMPSLNMSDESSLAAPGDDDDNILQEYQLRRKWEQQAHPYIIFHSDDTSMEFLGFHINDSFDALDAYSGTILEKDVINKTLYENLNRQGVPFNVKYENLSRQKQLEALCRVFGVNNIKDPDESYQLTLDNTMKMMAIHLRFQANIPVIVMGDTGCGKTRLVQFMCDLQRAGKEIKNMVLVRVHGGTTSKNIHQKVKEAIDLAMKNEKEHNQDTVLFFDEANTTEAVFAIKEVLCDKCVNGELILTTRLKIVAACNPYKRHTKEAIELLEKAGLGYRVHAEDTIEKLGFVPLRQLVYRVHPLPPSMLPLVWDFGQLNKETQNLYITEIVKTTIKNRSLPKEYVSILTSVISASQQFLGERKDECRIASLRDIERCMKVILWFYDRKDILFPLIDKKCEESVDPVIRALVLAVGVCYYASLKNRQAYLEAISSCLSKVSENPLSFSKVKKEITMCQEVFLDHLVIPEATAKNDALRENIFMMVVCMDLRVPLFLVGKPGSSKSLSKTIIADAMQGKFSKNDLLKKCKQLQLVSFQCSPHSKPEGIISTFRQCAQFQRDQNLEEFASAVVLDEIGLAEDSPQMPLKTLHPLLEDGCVDDDNPEQYKKVGFIGISNWALDPAKMNRGLLVLRDAPERGELVNTAKGICAGEEKHSIAIEHLFPKIASSYEAILDKQKNEFYGLRDFYSVIKMLLSSTIENRGVLSEQNIVRAILRNFGGSDKINPVIEFSKCFPTLGQVPEHISNTLSLLQDNLDMRKSGFASRYLLLLTTNHAALHIIQMKNLMDINDCDIIYGSGFPKDQEYSQVCRSVNRVKICMETGRPVILLNIHNLYESLYDALNQCFVRLGGNYYVDLGLGTHRVKCRVKETFRLVVIEDKDIVYEQFPTPLLNRLEKHILEMNNILGWCLLKINEEMQVWTDVFLKINENNVTAIGSRQFYPRETDVFIGYSKDTLATVTLQSCPKNYSSSENLLASERNKVFETAKNTLINCATPDSILRLKYTDMENVDQIQDMYFAKQKHTSLIDILECCTAESLNGIYLEVSTHARLLNQRDKEEIQRTLMIEKEQIRSLDLTQFDTEEAFRRYLRKFFLAPLEKKLLLVQFAFDEPQSSKRLLACAKFCIADEKRKNCKGALYVVILTKLPRILGGCNYLAFSGGEWQSLHLDELLTPKYFAGNLGKLSKMTISEMLIDNVPRHTKASGIQELEEPEDEYTTEKDENVPLINIEFLIKQCIQKAVIQLKDKEDNSKRTTERIHILYNLLHQSNSKTWVSEKFIDVLKSRIFQILMERDRRSPEPKDWLTRRALSQEYVLEGTSFRHSVWIYLEEIVANAFAQILAMIDKDNNLNHVATGAETPSSNLWIQMFEDFGFLKIPYANECPNAKILVGSTIEDPNTTATCHFPFSWTLKASLDQIWKTVYESKGFPEEPTQECAELFKNVLVKNNTPMTADSDEEMTKRYTDDFVRMSFPGQSQDVYKILSKVLLSSAVQLCKFLTSDEDHVEMLLIWIHMQHFYLQNNFQIFLDLIGIGECVTDKLVTKYSDITTETVVEIDAANIVIEMLEPTNNLLLPFENCKAWLERVKSFKYTMELILSDEYPLIRWNKAQELLTDLRHRWHCINIVYLLIDHLLHDETSMEETFLKLVVKQFVFLWQQLKKNTNHLDPVKTFQHVTGVLKICNKNAAAVYLVKGVTKCKYCNKEITDPAELPCGHIFCSHCIEEWENNICIDCKKEFPEDYAPVASPITRVAVENHNKFRRKCNSFFIEFVCNYCFGDKIPPSAEIIETLINFVACKPSSSGIREPKKVYVYKPTSDLSPFEECMDPSPTVKSSLLKMLLRCRLGEIEKHLQIYFSRMEDILESNQSSRDDFYFMVVRCIEDFIHFSQQNEICTKEKYISFSDLSSVSTDGVTTIEKLQIMAKIRCVLSTAAILIGEELQEECKDKVGNEVPANKHQMNLVESTREFIESADNPWLQIFLIRNLGNIFKLTIMKKIYRQPHWHWILPHALKSSNTEESTFIDKFLIYGKSYQDMTITIIRIKEHDPDFEFMKTQEDLTEKLVCLALASAREKINETPSNDACFITKLIRQQTQYPALQRIEPFYQALVNKKLTHQFINSEDSSLLEVVLHSGLIISISNHPVLEMFKSICFEPSKVKDMFLPTMPDDLLYEMNKWKAFPNERLWQCSKCKIFWSVENCGKPMEIKMCKCGETVGGTNHIPAKGFIVVENTTDKTETGYLLGKPSMRSTCESERNLSASSFLLCRILLHASIIWGSLKDEESIKKSMKLQEADTWEFFRRHLEKDMESLSAYIGNNADDASTAVHLFLKYVLESSTESDCNIKDILTRENRDNWEECWKKVVQSFFKGFDQKLASIKKQITENEPNILLKIVYGQSSPFNDLPTSGLINNPSMWRFEQRMTVQLLTRLIEQQDGKEKFPLLLELLTKHQGIQYIKYLPDILKLQQHLINFFQSPDIDKWKDKSISDFIKSEFVPDEQRSPFQETLQVIRKVWDYLKSSPKDQDAIPEEILHKNIDFTANILEFLPTKPSISYSIVEFLIMLQKTLIDVSVKITKEKQRFISAEAVKPLSVVNCVVETDLIPMALSNFQYMLEEDGTETTNYNFQTLQRQAIHRFISGRPTIKAQTIPCITVNNERTLHSIIKKVKDRLKQDPLSVSCMKRIMEEVRSVSDISNVLATLKVAAEFLSVTGGNPERFISEYVKNELKMDNKAQHFKNLPAVPQTKLKHILSLWQILSAKRSALLVEMNQNPFFLIDSCFHEDLSEDEEENLISKLGTINIDVFIIELHEMITVLLDPKQKDWGIAECFENYLDGKGTEEAQIRHLTSAMDSALTLEKVISVWNTAVRTRKSFVGNL
ncbi:E3 ubiquitin-protein ligase rnf213-alpha-like [Lissotriton helveticus]